MLPPSLLNPKRSYSNSNGENKRIGEPSISYRGLIGGKQFFKIPQSSAMELVGIAHHLSLTRHMNLHYLRLTLCGAVDHL